MQERQDHRDRPRDRRGKLRVLILLGAILYALTLPSPRRLRLYFWAQLLSTIVLELTLMAVGVDSPVYAAIFGGATALILATVVKLAWEALQAHHFKLLVLANASLIAGLLGWASQHGRALGMGEWIAVGEGTVLAWAAVVIGMCAAYMTRTDRNISLALMALWWAQSAFQFGFSLHFDSPFWLRLNYVAPTALIVTALVGMGQILKKKDTDVVGHITRAAR